MSQGSLSRRSLLRGALALGGSGFVLAATGGEVIAASSKLASKNTPVPFTNLFRRPPVLMPTETGEDEKGKFAKFRITEKIGQQSIAYCVTRQQLSARGADAVDHVHGVANGGPEHPVPVHGAGGQRSRARRRPVRDRHRPVVR